MQVGTLEMSRVQSLESKNQEKHRNKWGVLVPLSPSWKMSSRHVQQDPPTESISVHINAP